MGILNASEVADVVRRKVQRSKGSFFISNLTINVGVSFEVLM